jgi:DNA-binding NarL/FixJ family response regulator
MDDDTDARIRVLVADDHPVFRYGMVAILSADPAVEVVGEAATGEQVVELAEHLQPDVIVMDLNMPQLSGIEATRRIVARAPHIGVLVVTMSDDAESLFAAMRAGARGYVLKGANQADILLAIRAVARGEVIFGPNIARRLLRFFSTLRPQAPQRVFPELSERETELLGLMAQGKSNQEIAEQLALSLKTVRNHASNIFSKLQVADRAQAILRAREAGLGHEQR